MKLRAGIIGLGVGEAHIAGYQSHKNCEVRAVCDLSRERLEAVQKKFSIPKISTDADEILEDPEIDLVSVASYDNFHHDQVVKALEHDKHVFVEKPLCLYEKEASHIRTLLKARPSLKLSSNLILRQSPRFQRLKKMVEGDEFGNLFYVEGDYHYGRLHKITDGWRGELDFYSVVYGGSVHLIDLLIWLTGDTVDEVFAYGNQIASKDSQFRHRDFVVAILKFRSGLIGKVGADFGGVRPHFHGLALYGTKATFENDLPHGRLFRSREPGETPEKVTEAYPGIEKGGLIYRFVDSILNGGTAEVTTEDVFKTMSVCFAIEKSAEEGRPVPVRYL